MEPIYAIEISNLITQTTQLILTKNSNQLQHISSNLVKIEHLLEAFEKRLSVLEETSNDTKEEEKTLLNLQQKFERLEQTFLAFPKEQQEQQQYEIETDGLDDQELLIMHDQIMKHQDYQLDALSGLINKQKILGEAINDELEVQIDLLEDVQNRTDNTHERIKNAKNRMDVFLEENDGKGITKLISVLDYCGALYNSDFAVYLNIKFLRFYRTQKS
jgi:DNA-binding transcriptional regulator YbjK